MGEQGPQEFRFVVPVRVLSPNRTKGRHWAACARRAKGERVASMALAREAMGWVCPPGPYRVVLTRFGAGTMDPDNLANSLKHVQDGVADALRVDDGSGGVRWEYAQRKAKRGEHGVEITIESGRSPA